MPSNYPRHIPSRMNSHSLSAAGAKLAIENSKSAAAQLGSRSTPAKRAAAQENGTKGGRPIGS